MITISTSGSAVVFEFDDNQHYLQSGTIEVPINSLTLVTDDSEMFTFRKAATNDIFVSGLYSEIGMTKDELIAYYKANMVGSTGGGSGSGMTSGEVQTMIDDSISGKADTSAVTESINAAVSGKADTSAVTEAISAAVSGKLDTSTFETYSGSVETALSGKLDKNGTYIRSIGTINGLIVYNDGINKNIPCGKINSAQIIGVNKNFQLVETSAITSSITSASTDSQVPSAKAVYDALQEGGGGGNNVIEVTQAEYDALVSAGTVDLTALYVITDATEVDMSNYYTSAQTNSAITAAVSGKADTSAVTESINAAVSGKLDTSTFETYSGSVETALSGKQDTLSAGTNITISGNVISAEGGGKAIEAGRGIAITTGATADTVSFNLPISAGTGSNSLIIGYNTTDSFWKPSATGDYSIACGQKATASKQYAMALGYLTTASGERALAHGYNTVASGSSSHSEGCDSAAKGSYSHSEGQGCVSSGESSHSEGIFTNATNKGEHSQGWYNVSNKANTTFGNSGNTLFSVGNGTANNARHNAFEIRQNGDIYITLDGQDVKLQDNLGGGEVSSAITSGDTNAVAGGAVYDKFDEVEQVTAAALNSLNDALGGMKFVKLTQAQYDALTVKDPMTLYIITNVV